MRRTLLSVVLLALALLAAPLAAQTPPAAPAAAPVDDMSLLKAFGQLRETLKLGLDTNGALGQPVQAGEVYVIPVVGKAFGFGIGGGTKLKSEAGKNEDKGQGEKSEEREGLGAGAGGGMRPLAIVVVMKDGTVKVQRLETSLFGGMLQKALPMLKKFFQQRAQQWMRRRAAQRAPMGPQHGQMGPQRGPFPGPHGGFPPHPPAPR